MLIRDNENLERTTGSPRAETSPVNRPECIPSENDEKNTQTSDTKTPLKSGPNTPTSASEKHDSSVNDEKSSQTSHAETPPDSGPYTPTNTSEKQDSLVNVHKVDTKVIPKLNSMGKPFDDEFVLNKNNKTLRIPNSAVTLTLSDADLKDGTVCLASTFRNLYDIGKKLQLKENQQVASPAVEYVLVESNLKEPAIVTMPFIGVPENIKVCKIKSGHGSDLRIEDNELKRKDNVSDGSGEDFFEIVRGEISITVKSLSWFVCISCQKEHIFHLTGYLYGCLDYDDRRQEPHAIIATFRLYIADMVHCLKDYKQLMIDEEKNNVFLHSFRFKLSDEMPPTACIQLSLEPYVNTDWEHMKNPGYLDALQPEQEIISLRSITGCHKSQQYGLPLSKFWYLVSVERPAKLNCILRTAQKSETSAEQTTQPDGHVVKTKLLHEHFVERCARGNVNAQSAGHIRQPMSAADSSEGSDPQAQPSQQNEHDATLHGNRVRPELP